MSWLQPMGRQSFRDGVMVRAAEPVDRTRVVQLARQAAQEGFSGCPLEDDVTDKQLDKYWYPGGPHETVVSEAFGAADLSGMYVLGPCPVSRGEHVASCTLAMAPSAATTPNTARARRSQLLVGAPGFPMVAGTPPPLPPSSASDRVRRLTASASEPAAGCEGLNTSFMGLYGGGAVNGGFAGTPRRQRSSSINLEEHANNTPPMVTAEILTQSQLQPAPQPPSLARRLCEHAVHRARLRGFRAMRVDTVPVTDSAAIEAWTSCGLAIMCTLPGAFRHPTQGCIDAHVLYGSLAPLEKVVASPRESVLDGFSRRGSWLDFAGYVPPSPSGKSVDLNASSCQDFATRMEAIKDVAHILPAPSREFASGDWMIWMVHRAWLNDPSLTELDFGCMHMPPPHEEKRIAPKLMAALKKNTHIEVMFLQNSNLQPAQGWQLGEALRENTTLRVLNVESNHLDSRSVCEIASAIRANPGSRIEDLSLAHQNNLKFFGRPAEQAVGRMLAENERIVRLGFECDDAHWRNEIDRALLRNSDLRRRQQQATDSDGLPPPETRILGHLTLLGPPTAAGDRSTHPFANEAFRAAEAPCLKLFREYLLHSRKSPTVEQLRSFAKNAGAAPMPYSTAAPLLKECRGRLLDAAIYGEVHVKDSFGTGASGRLRGWVESNDRWNLDILTDEGKRFHFRSDREPALAISDTWLDWLHVVQPPAMHNVLPTIAGC